MYESLERAGFRAPPHQDNGDPFSNSKIKDKVQSALRGYPILHRSDTPQGYGYGPSEKIPRANITEYVIALVR